MKKIIFIIISILVIAVIILNLGVGMGKNDSKEEIIKKFQSLDLSKGVSRDVAVIIAQNYLITENYSNKDIDLNKYEVKQSGLDKNSWVVIFSSVYHQPLLDTFALLRLEGLGLKRVVSYTEIIHPSAFNGQFFLFQSLG